jgi:hypothetical protein
MQGNENCAIKMQVTLGTLIQLEALKTHQEMSPAFSIGKPYLNPTPKFWDYKSLAWIRCISSVYNSFLFLNLRHFVSSELLSLKIQKMKFQTTI